MQVYGYARFSTDRQTEASIEDQQRVCRDYAQRQGWIVAAEFIDEAISGAALGNRPGAIAVLARLQAGDVLLITDTYRLARSQDLAPMVERLRFRGVRVLGVLDGFDSDSPHARMQAGLSGLMSDEMRANIRARTHSALAMRAQQSKSTGGRCYGYDKEGQVIEAEAVIVREIFDRACAGEKLRDIVSDLNLRGIAAAGGSWKRTVRAADARWRVSGLHSLLENERYIGRITWNKSQWMRHPDTGVRERRERPQSEWIVRECPAIVDKNIFDWVRRRANERARSYGGGRGGVPRHLLSGLLVCAQCGHRMVSAGSGTSTQYRCTTYMQAGAVACSQRRTVRRDLADNLVLDSIRTNLLSEPAVEYAVALLRHWAREDARATREGEDPECARIDAEIADLRALIEDRPTRGPALLGAIEALTARKVALQRAAWREGTKSGLAAAPAEALYRAAVQEARETLAGSVMVAREALRGFVGVIPVAVAPEGHLVATVRMTLLPLLAAAGCVLPDGSGGRI